MKQRTRIIISVMLSLVMLLGCIPLSIFSASAEEIEPETLPDETKITEITEYRGENEKHFSLPDGTIEAIAYPQAVHRLDSSGEWKDIDNDLSLRTVGNKQLYTTEDSRVSFASGYVRNQPLVTLNENGYSISMALLDNQNDHISTETLSFTHIDNAEQTRPESFDTLEEATRIDNRVSISYSDVMNYTNIEYILSGNDIKENIVVKARRDSYEYGFLLALDGLDAELGETGEILLRDETSDEVRYIIPAPYMYDSNNEYSNEVSYELYHAGGDKYLLTVIADEEWINQDGREFPVRIDPTTTSTGYSADTYINSRLPNNNYGSISPLPIYATTTVLINVSLPEIPSLAFINTAYLYMTYYMLSNAVETHVGAYAIQNSWVENTVNYNSNLGISSYLLDSRTFNYNSSVTYLAPGTKPFLITSAISDYYNKGTAFNGIALKALSTNPSVLFMSREASYAPYISINYSGGYEGLHFVKNAGTGYYLDIDNIQNANYQAANAAITVSPLSSLEAHTIWYFSYFENGYYKISSIDSYKHITVQSDYINSSGGAYTQQEYNALNTQLWSVLKSNAGNYIIRPKSGEAYSADWCMATGISGLATNQVGQIGYTSDTNYKDEWYFEGSGIASLDVPLAAQETEVWCWAASAKMFADTYYDLGSVTQLSAVNAVATAIENKSFTESELREYDGDIGAGFMAINYYIGQSNLVSDSYVKIYEDKVCTEAGLIALINAGEVIYISRGTYDVNYNRLENGHASLIYGYITVDGGYYFLIRDPAPVPKTTNGMKGGKTTLMSYNKIYNGYYSENGQYEYYQVWEGFIIRQSAVNAYYLRDRFC